MIEAFAGTGGPCKPDPRPSPSHCTLGTLLGRSCAGPGPDDQPGRQHLHSGDVRHLSGRSASLARVGLSRDSCPHDLQDGLEINPRACEI